MNPVNRLAQRVAAIAILISPGFASADVEIMGLDDALETNARALVALASSPCEAPRWRVERLYRSADTELQGALEALGYYTYTLEKELSFDDAECWKAFFTIELGSPVLVDEVELSIQGEARDDLVVAEGLEARKPAIGSVLNHGDYEALKRTLLTRLGDRGYFGAEVIQSEVVVNESLTTASIKIEVDSGPRYRFGELSFTEELIDTEITSSYRTFEPGEYFDSEAISELHEEIRGSGYFGTVSIRSDPDSETLIVPIVVTVQPAKRHRFSTAIGYSTDTGLHGKFGYANRRLNNAGHQLETELFLSEVDSEITANYRWPRASKRRSWYEAYAGYQSRRTDTSESDKTTVGLRLVRQRSSRWLETPYLDLTHEDYLVADQRDQSTLLIPGIIWEAAEGRELQRVDKGWRISADVRASYKALLSDATFGQVTTAGKLIRSFGGSGRILIRGELGTTFGASISNLPATVRYFTGGDTSVRGYDFETIGSLDENGEVIGGSNLVTFSLETDWLVWGNWAVAAFADTGSAFNESDLDLKTGVGLGVRWFSPFGPVRLDVAHPLDNDDDDFRIHITLGPDL